MKIAIVAGPYCPIPPEKYGGSEAMIDCLARALHRAGHDVTLIAREGSTCPVPTKFIDPGAQPHAFSALCHEVSYVISAYEGLEEYDVVHDHTTLGPAYKLAFPHLPIVVTNHGPFEGILNTIYEKEAKWIDQFVAISNSQAKGAPMPVEVIHHGIDSDMYEYGEGTGDDKGEYLFFLARMQWIKGPEIAIRIAKENNMRLVLAAKMEEKPEFEHFEKYVEPHLNDDITFVGEVGGRTKVDLLRNAKALLNPIQWPEPFGLTMTEALSCGTPVIAMRNGSVPELINDGVTGFVCDSEAEMSAAVGKLDQIERKACRQSVEDYFNMDRMAADYLKIYERVAEQKKAQRVVDLREGANANA